MTEPRSATPLRIGVVGHGFMGRAHALAWRAVTQLHDLPLAPELAVVVGRDPLRAERAARTLGFRESAHDWRALIGRADIDVVDICSRSARTPRSRWRPCAPASTCCARSRWRSMRPRPAQSAAAAADAGPGIVATVGFNYRRVPALALAARLCEEGRLGRLRHIRARYLQDWLASAEAPWTWRLDAGEAGSGALGDLGSHLIDLVAFVTGTRIVSTTALRSVFVDRRTPDGAGGGRAVTVDDACAFMARTADGLAATFDMSRCALGSKNRLTLELDGSEGSVGFDLERLNELRVYSGADDEELRGFRRILVTEPVHPYLEAWWPAGHTLGWDATFVHQAHDFVLAVAGARPCPPTFADGRYVQEVIESVLRSSVSERWESVLDDTAWDAGARDGRAAGTVER